MPWYLAVVKVRRSSSAVKTQFKATNNSEAIEGLLHSVGCQSLQQVDEFDLMEILEGGQYLPVAAKMGNDLQHAGKPVVEVVQKKVANISKQVNVEATYTSYTYSQA